MGDQKSFSFKSFENYEKLMIKVNVYENDGVTGTENHGKSRLKKRKLLLF